MLVKFTEMERTVVTRGERGGNGELFHGQAVLQRERSSGGWLHNVSVRNTTELYSLKWKRWPVSRYILSQLKMKIFKNLIVVFS